MLQNYLNEVLAPRPRFRLNVSPYWTPFAAWLRIALIGVTVLLLVGIAWDLLDWWGLRSELGGLARSAARLREQDRRILAEAARDGMDLSAAALTRLPAEVKFVNRLVEKRTFSWTHFLSELEGTVPAGVGVSSIRLDPNGAVIQMTGTARTFEDVTAFLTLLHDHAEFHDPVLKQHQDRGDGSVEFQLTLHYRSHDTRS